MGGRTSSRLQIFPRAVWHRWLGSRTKPQDPRRILLAHNLLLGDTLMLAPLLAKLRQRYPHAEIACTVKPAFLPLFAGQPYGVKALPYNPRDAGTVKAIIKSGGYDLALVPGDNRYGWLAAAANSHWIRAFAEDKPSIKGAAVDETVPYPARPAAWADMNGLLVDGPEPRSYQSSDWPAPPCRPFDIPKRPYAVLHVGASTPLKFWPAARWRELADWLAGQGISVVWSCGPGEQAALAGLPRDGEGQYPGTLDLAQLWRLVADARLLVCPDTGIAHIGKLTGTPTVALFGPGAADIYGAGEYWRTVPYRAVTESPFPCRDQHRLFGREISWVQRCGRGLQECSAPRCMEAISEDSVRAAIGELL